MLKTISAAFLAAMTVWAAPLAAAPVASIDMPFAFADYTVLNGTGSVTAVDFAAGQGFAYSGDLMLDLAFDFDTANPYGTATGTFLLWDDTGSLLDGMLTSVAANGPDLLTLSFGNLNGSLTTVFGDLLTLDMFFFDGLGNDPLRAMTNRGSYMVALNGAADIAAVPLPAGGVLVVSGLAALAGLRRLRKA